MSKLIVTCGFEVSKFNLVVIIAKIVFLRNLRILKYSEMAKTREMCMEEGAHVLWALHTFMIHTEVVNNNVSNWLIT